ncbi:hypothetical protein ACFQ07_25230 [Actinomadura adrarensis]|uniref:DUF4190 domain-containing protein n=1 Tax=Actinomadura adrarensis TaxID=1819600 RepID=A0ABW3CM17_9ACTN
MLDVTISWTAELFQHVVWLASQPIPTPSSSTEPPGADAFRTLLGWAVWGAFLCCVGGFIIIGARMGIQHKRGEGGNHMGSLVIVGFACVIIALAATIVTNISEVAK